MWPKPPVEHHQPPTLPTAVGHLQYVTKNTRTGRSAIAIPARSAVGGRCNQLKPGDSAECGLSIPNLFQTSEVSFLTHILTIEHQRANKRP